MRPPFHHPFQHPHRAEQAAERPIRPALLPHPLLRPQLQDPLRDRAAEGESKERRIVWRRPVSSPKNNSPSGDRPAAPRYHEEAAEAEDERDFAARAHCRAQAPFAARLLFAHGPALALRPRVRASQGPVRDGPRHRKGLRRQAPPDRRGRHRHRQDARLSAARPAPGQRTPAARHHLHRNEKSTGAALLQGRSIPGIDPRPAQGLLHEGPQQLPMQAQALCAARFAAADGT